MLAPALDPRPFFQRLESLNRRVHGVPLSVGFDGGKHALHVVFGTMVHGNEVGPLPAVVALAEALADGSTTFGGRVSFFVGNPEAAFRGVRLVEADLNRVFVDTDHDTIEHRRSRELRRILDTADLFVDFHQVNMPTPTAFYIFPWSKAGEAWVRALDAAPRWVTRPPGKSFSPGTCCADEYVRNRGRVALTVEVSRAGPSAAAEALTLRTMKRALEWADRLAERGADLPDASLGLPMAPLPQCLATAFAQRFDDPAYQLRDGLDNFVPVEAGERMSVPGTPELVSPVAGYVMMAKYPPRDAAGGAVDPRPGEIYRVLQELPVPPAQLYGEETPA